MIYNLINGFLYKISSSSLNIIKLISKSSVSLIVPYNYQVIGYFIIDESFSYIKPINKSSIRIISICITSSLCLIYIIYTYVKKNLIQDKNEFLEYEDFVIV